MGKRLKLELDKLESALAVFAESIDEDETRKARDSMLLRFVFTFEMAWRCMRFALAENGLETPDYSAAVLRAALQGRIITDADLWDQIRTSRNAVSHAYDEGRAIAIAAFVRANAVAAFEDVLKRLRAGA